MFLPTEQAQGLTHSLVAQTMTTSEFSNLVFLSGPQFFIALIAGLVMAFAFQFLLTNLTVAAGISSEVDPFEEDEAKSWGKQARSMESKVGGWMLFTVNAALFTACFLAVKLTLIQSIQLGAIVGVVIWSAYFLLLLWAGSRTVGSAVSAVGSTASAGVQGVVGTVATALGGSAVNSQIVNTVEASVAAVTQQLKSELSSDMAPDRLRENVADYLKKLRLPGSELGDMNKQILTLLKNAAQPSASSENGEGNSGGNGVNLTNIASEVAKAAAPGGLTSGLIRLAQSAAPEELKSGKLQDVVNQLNRTLQAQSGDGLQQQVVGQAVNALVSTVAQRVDLSDVDVEQIGQQLSSLGQQASNQASRAADRLNAPGTFSLLRTDIENYLLKSPSWYLRSENLDSGFREVLRDPDADAGLVRQQIEPLNRRYFVSVLQRRDGLDDSRINDLADQLELIRQEVLSQVRDAEEEGNRQDLRQQVETYLSSAPKEALASDRIAQDFPALLADPEASYETVGNRLVQFDRDTLRQMLLSGRQDLDENEIEPMLDALEQARDRILNQSQEQWSQMQHQAGEFRGRVEAYLRETNPTDLSLEQIQQNLERLANLPESGLLVARAGLGQLDRDSLEQMLAQREDLSQEQVHQIVDQVESVRHSIVHAPQELAGQAQDQINRLISQIADYLRNTNLDELDPDGIRHDLQQLLQSPQAGSAALRRRLAQVDRDTLARLLSQQGLSEYQVNQAIDLVLDSARTVVKAPQRLATRARDQVQDVQSILTEYLKNTDREELNPEAMERDLRLLLSQPREGLEQWQERLAQFDRGTLVALLSQRDDISEQQANQMIDQVEAVRYDILRQAKLAKDQVQDTVQSTAQNLTDRLRGYLDALDRPELNYDAIKRDMSTLFNDPEAGFEALTQRLGQFDRETLTALLSTRTDISEEQVNQVIDQIEAARDSALHQAQRLQEEAEKRISALKHEAKEQLQEVRKTAATAAWWLFGTALTSLGAAAIAGILAARGLEFLS
ncbi:MULTISPECIES: MFS transporter [Cyanophyceae]|uniref:MFS transporter n=1 Tax=Cyanophyceae TaxID=3028117 RepID=UPI001682B373|nr:MULTISPECIES: MFS transporter [Cyanophyceae]MBD1918272.1 MFS transporter [Phormidium sp. FACHB-77]MBD2031316.1 MFS transporter [Phormidium sp. FACHB-322]MBD2052383.1 MFS transporter [Leptolyngbya sp. FACHB-60]